MVTMTERIIKVETRVEGIDSKMDDMKAQLIALKTQIESLDDKFVLRKEFVIIVGILGTIGTISLGAIVTILVKVFGA